MLLYRQADGLEVEKKKKKLEKKRKVISRDRYIQFECVCAEVSKKKKHYQAKRGG